MSLLIAGLLTPVIVLTWPPYLGGRQAAARFSGELMKGTRVSEKLNFIERKP
jgi:hypothetical protein